MCGRNIKIRLLAFNKRLRSYLWTKNEAQTLASRRIGCHQRLTFGWAPTEAWQLQWEKCFLWKKSALCYQNYFTYQYQNSSRVKNFPIQSQITAGKDKNLFSPIPDAMLRWQRSTFLKFCCCIIHRALCVVIWFLLCWFDSKINLASTMTKATTMFRKSSRLD